MKNRASISIASRLALSVPLYLVTLVAAPLMVAAQVLDQSFQPSGPLISTGTSSGQALAQTFTVGVGGTLTRFDAWIVYSGERYPVPPVTWEILPTSNGVPVESDTASLASGTFLSSVAPQNWSFYTIDLASPISVSAGEVLAIVLSTPPGYNGVSVSWQGEAQYPYPDGYAFVGTPVGVPGVNETAWSTSFLAGYDLGFRTYVQPVPEPSSVFLVFVGVCALLAIRRRHC